MIAYWRATNGRALPMPVKRGIADAVLRLYNERAALKYDGQGQTMRMGDVIDIVHPKPKAPWQAALFKYLLDKRHNREDADDSTLPMIAKRRALEAMPADARRDALNPELLAEAGATWEWASSWLGGALDAKFWEAMIPSMGYMALLRNLRNFDEAAISDAVKLQVAARLADPEQVAKSRQLPLRFYSAWKAARSMAWGTALEAALNQSVQNVPVLSGRTLVLVDTSGSMADHFSDKGKAQRWETAALFGAALALRAESADLVSFQSDTRIYRTHKGDSVLRTVDAIGKHVGGGTNTFQAIAQHYSGQDRIVILTDEQAHPYGLDPTSTIAAPIYTFNLAGYRAGHMASARNRHTFGGLSDKAFVALSLLERGGAADWPF